MGKIGIKDKVGYLVGDLANDLSFMMVTMYLMVFYTDVLGVSAAFVGMLFFCARIWDAFVDVMWGRFIDLRPMGKNGRFRPWFMRFSVPFLIIGILMFTKIPGMSDTFYLIYATLGYIIWGTLFSIVNIPYGSLASVMTSDPGERTSLSAFRNIGSTIAVISIGVFGPLVLFVNNKADAERFVIAMVVIAVVSMICYILCYNMTTERIVKKTNTKAESNFKETLRGLGKNRAFLVLILVSILLMFGSLSVLNAYLYKDYFHNVKAMSIVSVLGVLNILIIPPLVPKITKKYGKKESISVMLLLASITYFMLFLLPITDVYVFIGISFIGNLFAAFFSFAVWAFVGEVIDYHEYITDKREDGTVYSFYTFSRKIGQAITGGAVGFLLAAIGYVQKAPQQVADVALNIKRVATLVPSISYFLMFLALTFLYPLTKAKTQEIAKNLEERRSS